MKIRLVSRDCQVEKLCREGLTKLCDSAWALYPDPDGRDHNPAELSIVDADSLREPDAECERSNGAAPILLYRQERLLAMSGRLPVGTLLLKPLRREFFLTALCCAIEQFDESGPSQVGDGEDSEAAEPEGLWQQVLGTSLELQRFHERQMNFLTRGLMI